MLSCEYKEGIPVAIGAELKRRPWAHSLHHFAASLSITHTYHTIGTSGFFRCYKIMEMAWKHGQLEVNVGHVIWLFINCRYTTFKQHFWFDFFDFWAPVVCLDYSVHVGFTPVFFPHHNLWFQHLQRLHVFRVLSSGNCWEIWIDCRFQVYMYDSRG